MKTALIQSSISTVHTVVLAVVSYFGSAAHPLAAPANPPPGFTALFNGKDLDGWRGGETFDHRKWLAMPEAERAATNAEWTADMRKHWRVEDGELVNDGKGKYAATENDYGDFELLVEYRTVPKADSGIYLRGCPQVQIWDSTEKEKFSIGADKGSGGLWNNSPGAPGKDPLVQADKPFGEWNSFRIIMVGAKVSVGSTANRWWITRPWKITTIGRRRFRQKVPSSCRPTAAKFAGGTCSSAKSALKKRTISCSRTARKVSSRCSTERTSTVGPAL